MEITVIGSARESAPPQRAELSLSVTREASGAREAVDAVSALLARLHAAVEDLEAQEPSPVEAWTVGAIRTQRPFASDPAERGYEASAPVTVTFRTAEALAAAADAWGGLDGVTLDDVAWRLAPDAEADLRECVLADAVRDAFARARVVAAAAGVGDVTPVHVADPGLLPGTGSSDGPMPRALAGRAMAGGPVDLRPDDVEISATVHARFTA